MHMIRRKRTCWTAMIMACVLLISGCSVWPGQDDAKIQQKGSAHTLVLEPIDR